jgi:hypothetical protein
MQAGSAAMFTAVVFDRYLKACYNKQNIIFSQIRDNDSVNETDYTECSSRFRHLAI